MKAYKLVSLIQRDQYLSSHQYLLNRSSQSDELYEEKNLKFHFLFEIEDQCFFLSNLFQDIRMLSCFPCLHFLSPNHHLTKKFLKTIQFFVAPAANKK